MASGLSRCFRLELLLFDQVPRVVSAPERVEYPDALDCTEDAWWQRETSPKDRLSAQTYKRPRHSRDQATRTEHRESICDIEGLCFSHLNSWLLKLYFVEVDEIEQMSFIENGTSVGLERINKVTKNSRL